MGASVRNTISLAAAAALLTGCTTIPVQLAQSNVTPREINDAVRCEVAYALASGTGDVGFFSDWNAGIVLTTKLIDHATAKPGVTISGSVNDVEWKSPTSIDYSDKRTGEAKITYGIAALSTASVESCPQRGSHLASTGLGLAEWLEWAGSTLTPKTSGDGRINTLKYNIDFSVERSVGGGLTFKTDHLDFALNENTISRKNDNGLVIEFAAPPVVANGKVKGASPRGRTVEQLQSDIIKEQEQPRVIQVEPGETIIVD